MLPFKRAKSSSEHYFIDDISKLYSKKPTPTRKQRPQADTELVCREQFVAPSHEKFVTLVNAPKEVNYLLRFSVQDSINAHEFCARAIESRTADKAYCFLHVSCFSHHRDTASAPQIFVELETQAQNYHAVLLLIRSSFHPEPDVTAYRTI
jgi:hypothetical protein